MQRFKYRLHSATQVNKQRKKEENAFKLRVNLIIKLSARAPKNHISAHLQDFNYYGCKISCISTCICKHRAKVCPLCTVYTALVVFFCK